MYSRFNLTVSCVNISLSVCVFIKAVALFEFPENILFLLCFCVLSMISIFVCMFVLQIGYLFCL